MPVHLLLTSLKGRLFYLFVNLVGHIIAFYRLAARINDLFIFGYPNFTLTEGFDGRDNQREFAGQAVFSDELEERFPRLFAWRTIRR